MGAMSQEHYICLRDIGPQYNNAPVYVDIFVSAPSDNMTDIQSLSMYLREQDEKDYKAALSKIIDDSS